MLIKLLAPLMLYAKSTGQVEYIDVPKRTLMTVPGYTEPVEFGVLTSFA
jgi:valyl-tRNA synthetase